MSKLIAIWGAPNSGKTTFATKLALSIYESFSSTVLELLCQNETPALPVLFHTVTNLYQSVLNTVGISLILAIGFSAALPVLIAILAVSFILSLILLAAQRD